MHRSLGQHGVIFDLRSSQGWRVARNQHQFGFTAAHALEGALVAEEVLATLDGEGETGVDVLGGLLDLLGGRHCSEEKNLGAGR